MTRRTTRPASHAETTLLGPVELDGECPVCGAVYGIDDSRLLPEHQVPPVIGRPVCTGSGQPAVRVQPRPFFFVEGVRWA